MLLRAKLAACVALFTTLVNGQTITTITVTSASATTVWICTPAASSSNLATSSSTSAATYQTLASSSPSTLVSSYTSSSQSLASISTSTSASVSYSASASTFVSLASFSATASANSTSSSATASASVSASANSTSAVGGQAVANTILVFARDSDSAYSATSGLNGYGIPYQLVIVPQAGITLPTLNSSTTQGNYGGIIILSEVSYDYSTGYASALTDAQFQQLYNYQVNFGIRMVRLDVYPDGDFGATVAPAGTGCCDSGVEQLVSISNATGFATANLKTGAGMSTQGMYHYPAVITDPGTTWEIAQFAPDSGNTFTTTTTAAVINDFAGRQQMAWFTSWATSWSATSNLLQHAYIHWMTRGLFVGSRKIYLNTQIDDIHLTTHLYSPAGNSFRLRPADLEAHVSWMQNINTRLPAGSNYFVELGHNGNGDIIAATNGNTSLCNPGNAIYYTAHATTSLEYQKPVGSGVDIWPQTPTTYTWSVGCASIDTLASWFMTTANRDAFSHISHTFTHENLDNATYNDANKEIFFNVAWLNQVGISAGRFSANGLIPPAITGMHNGDVIRAWMANDITIVVGDNSRPVLMNQDNEFWPLVSTVDDNGYAGLTIMPRWPTNIFYDCDLPACTTDEWTDTASGDGVFSDLLGYERTTNTRHLLALHHDPFMFHQANLRASDVSSTTVGSQTGQFSLLQTWVETITQEMSRLTNWPITTLKHSDIGQKFIDRMTRDACAPNLAYSYSADGTHITAVTVTANGNACSAPIPVTFPGAATSSATTTADQVGSEPLIEWVTLTGSPVKFTLATPVVV